ncbi:hypothetical protein [Streptomyces atroolivaceus]|uniref:Secreted protein n=1 Tax=Streptomyces atroolivaceus TaxID=66869 RepID=A0ABV9V8X3_STRAZ|nr:hypothetical protein [Streptomyces atroolivaceus]
MQFDLVSTLAAVSLVGIISVVSDSLRSILRAIFRRPRRTSLIVEIDGKRVEVSGSSPEEIQTRLNELLSKETDDGDTSHGSTSQSHPVTAVPQDGVFIGPVAGDAAAANSTTIRQTAQQVAPPVVNGSEPAQGGGSSE